MKKSYILALIAAISLSCNNYKQKISDNEQVTTEVTDQPFLERIEYSNLLDKPTQEEVKQALVKGGVSSVYADSFLENVNLFNQTVGEVGLVEKGFSVSDSLKVAYDEATIISQWEQKNPAFVGYNCRITAFEMLRDLVSVGKAENSKPTNLFVDIDALETNPKKVFSDSEKENFLCLFSSVPTGYHKDINKHLENLQKAFKERDIKFAYKGDTSKASLVSVVFHSAITEEPDDVFLFIGHTGVLVPTNDGKLLFIEKLAFEEPYQAIKFRNRTELNDYLMNRYDVEKGQPTAKPFIIENDELLQGYRSNAKNIE